MRQPFASAFLTELKARSNLVALAQRATSLRRAGDRFVGLCPFHSEKTPSFHVVPSRGFYHCFGCGAHGGPIDLVMQSEGLDFADAVLRLAAYTGLPVGESAPRHLTPTSPTRIEAERDLPRNDRERAKAFRLWLERKPLAGSVAETYLVEARGLSRAWSRTCPVLGFAPRLGYWAPIGDRPELIWQGPALLAAMQDRNGRFAAIHITWLRPDGSGKLELYESPGMLRPAKKVRGLPSGAAIRLTPAAPRMAIGEGIETTASVLSAKDASSEQIEARNSALGKLLARTVRSKTNFDERVKVLRADMQHQYQALLNENQNALNDVSAALQTRLSEWAHPDARLRLQWKQDPDKSVRVEEPWAHILAGEGNFEGELARFGHGLQRSYLLALLHELAGTETEGAPTLILACEEPELYQHPPQARHLASVLHKLSRGNSQVIVCTHNPLFVSGEGFEDVRMVRKQEGDPCSTASHMTFSEIATAVAGATGEPPTKPAGALAKVHQALQPGLNEMFFTRRLVLVEGLEDVAYILAYLNLIDRSDDFRRLGCHIVPANGKSELLQPLVIAKHMRIPTYLVFDSDADKPDKNGSKAKHEKDNKGLLALAGTPGSDPMPTITLRGAGFTMWHSDIGAVVEAEIGVEDWAAYRAEADKRYGHAGGLRKNSLHIGASLAFAWDAGKRSPSLQALCEAILNPSETIPT